MNKFLIIKTGGTFENYAAEHKDFEDWTAKVMGLSTNEWDCVNVQEGDSLPDPGEYLGCAITGSHDMVTEDHDWIRTTEAWLREAADTDLPIFGICFGHQMLAQAFGGKAGFHPNGPEIGTMTISMTDAAQEDPLFSKLPDTFPGHTTHYQCALELPQGATLLAASVHEPHQAFRIGSHIWGVQFHPEFDAAAERNYVAQQADAIREHGGDVDAALEGVKDTPESTSLMRLFVQYCRKENTQ
ncbi:glutamine amidotransferase [Pseudodesulfovibrio sp. zrk46]|uniref:glutamine amidotransferase n=1 Tax=Pseudodesulfovibrio sp. zrk46 TaxID=2725288 RepID=UPI00144920CD|nr:glutamine amidotransferase [Pseudodesulfovibrio sp. zrk46]QJB55585.1 glutamine amidotransferase [Pseudodesulfovibrio sp. zrk46]